MKKLLTLLCASLLLIGPLAQAQTPISNLPQAAPANGSEVTVVDQTVNGKRATRQMPVSTILNGAFASPPAIGSTTPSTGQFTTVTALSATVSGDVSAATFNGYKPANGATFVDAASFGVSTASPDNSAAFMAIDAAGVVAVLKPGVYNVTKQIRFVNSHTGIRCASNQGDFVDPLWNNTTNDYPLGANGCWLLWTGSGQPKNPDGPNGTDGTNGAMITFNAPVNPTNGIRLHGNVLQGIGIDGNNGLLQNAIQMKSVAGGVFTNLVGWNIGVGIFLDVNEQLGAITTVGGHTGYTKSPQQIAEAQPGQMNEFDNIFVGPFGGVTCIHAFFASFDRFSNIYCQSYVADMIQLVGADNLHFYNVVTQNNYGTPNTYFGVHIMAATVNYNDGSKLYYPSNSNTFWGISGTVKADGSSDASTIGCTSWLNANTDGNTCTFGNKIYDLDSGNGVQDVLVGTGAQLTCTKNDGTSCFPQSGVTGNAGVVTQMLASLAIGDSYVNQKQAANGAAAAQEGLRIRNTHEAHLTLEDNPDGGGNTTQWYIREDTAGGPNGNLDLFTNGTGYVRDFGHYTSQFQVGQIQDVGGYVPSTNTGACTGVGPATGGSVAGKFTMTSACSSQIHLVFPNAAAHGWVCTVQDTTNTSITMRQVNVTSNNECDMQVLGATTGASDVMVYQAVAY